MRKNYCYKLTFEVGGDFIVDHNNSKCEDGDAGFSDETLHLGEYGSSSGNEVTIVEGDVTDGWNGTVEFLVASTSEPHGTVLTFTKKGHNLGREFTAVATVPGCTPLV